MTRIINIQPVTRIEGHARVNIRLDERGDVAETRLHLTSMRGFEKFIEGRPAEEVPRIVSRICGICPWMHHTASNKAVDACFGAQTPLAGRKLRQLMLLLAHVGDKILHFFFLAAPDFLLDGQTDPQARNVLGIAQAAPDLARRVVRTRQAAQAMLEKFAGKVIHPVAMVPGGFAKPMSEGERRELLFGAKKQLEFALYAMSFAKENVFAKLSDADLGLGGIRTGFLGMVNASDGSLELYDGVLRLMRPDGGFEDFDCERYADYLGEHVEPWSYGKFPYARCWDEGFSMDHDSPKGVYRTNTLARINVCEGISTPRAQDELEEFRRRFGRPAQSTTLYHWARLIELVHVCEKAVEMLEDPGIIDPEVRAPVEPRTGRGVGCVEAPRGTLIHDYTTDENGCIKSANMIVGTTHNVAPMNMSVAAAARRELNGKQVSEVALNRVEMALRAYDP